jgi:peptide/nickel transport system permease protein
VIRFIGRRLLVLVPTVFVVSTFAFILVQLVPGDPAAYILGNTATTAKIKALDAQLGLNRPVLNQYFSWLSGVLHGNFGTSFITNVPVTSTLRIALQPTVSLAVLATIVMLVAGIAIGMLAAIRGGVIDTALQTLASFFMAIPGFWLAAVLIYAFSFKIRWFPATGYTYFNQSPAQWITGLVIPVVAVAGAFTAQVALQARSSVLDVISRDFVRTLQAAGIPRHRILLKHVLRNAAIPVATVAGLNFIFMLSGIVVIEVLFNIPGMGSLMVNAVSDHDLPVLQGAVIYFSIVVVVVSLAADLLTGWLDPRIRTR